MSCWQLGTKPHNFPLAFATDRDYPSVYFGNVFYSHKIHLLTFPISLQDRHFRCGDFRAENTGAWIGGWLVAQLHSMCRFPSEVDTSCLWWSPCWEGLALRCRVCRWRVTRSHMFWFQLSTDGFVIRWHYWEVAETIRGRTETEEVSHYFLGNLYW